MRYTNHYRLPGALEEVVKGSTYDPSNKPNRIGITTLINPIRISQLTVRHWKSLSEDISDHIWRIMGNSVHAVLSNVKKDNRLIEKKIEIEIDGIIIVGKIDLYDCSLKSLSDWKITSTWSVKEIKEEYITQLNCYSFLLRKTGFPVEKAYINAILKDWSQMQFKRYGGDYPPIPFKQLEIPLWSLEQQEQYIKERIALYKESLKLEDKDLPLCSEEERWRTPEKWAIYKNRNKTATRLLDTEEKAMRYIVEIGVTKDRYRIEKREGQNNRCSKYCIVKNFCNYYKGGSK